MFIIVINDGLVSTGNMILLCSEHSKNYFQKELLKLSMVSINGVLMKN